MTDHQNRIAEMTPEEVAGWCRTQAKMFGDMAANIERAFRITRRTDDSPSLPKLGKVTREQVFGYLRERPARVLDLAKHFAVEPHVIESLLGDPTMRPVFERNERGWITLKEKVDPSQPGFVTSALKHLGNSEKEK